MKMEIVFTEHANGRIKFKRIPYEDVIDGIKYPDETIKKHGKYYFRKKLQTGTIEICCERTESNIKVITVYWL